MKTTLYAKILVVLFFSLLLARAHASPMNDAISDKGTKEPAQHKATRSIASKAKTPPSPSQGMDMLRSERSASPVFLRDHDDPEVRTYERYWGPYNGVPGLQGPWQREAGVVYGNFGIGVVQPTYPVSSPVTTGK